MTDHDALLAAILHAPADDAPRLVYADCLDENGEPERAEFIRVQCELARLGPPHVVLRSPVTLSSRLGPNYWTLAAHARDNDEDPIWMLAKVGDRVGLLKPETLKGKKLKPMHGLRVHAMEGDPLNGRGNQNTVLVEDSESKPWAGEELRRRERELWTDKARIWFDLPQHNFLRSNPTEGDFASLIDGTLVRGIVRRGFVDELRCSLAAFLGEKCRTCFGQGRIVDHVTMPGGVRSISRKCHDCTDGKRTPGVVEIFRTSPVTAVVLTDREPHAHPNGRYSWSLSPDRDDDPRPPLHRDWIPGCLWKLLSRIDQRAGTREYANRKEAREAISLACVVFGRRYAGIEEAATAGVTA